MASKNAFTKSLFCYQGIKKVNNFFKNTQCKINTNWNAKTLKTGKFLDSIFCVYVKKKSPDTRFQLPCPKISNQLVFVSKFAIDI